MALSTLIYFLSFVSSCIGTIFINPVIGIAAYLFIYNVGPMSKWWASPLWHMGLRDSFLISIALMIGFFIKRTKIDLSLLSLDIHEWLLIFFIAVMWGSRIIGLDLGVYYYNIIKITKVMVILMFASHIVTSIKRYELVLWVFILSNMYIGYNALFAESWMFTTGRLTSGIGGVDFDNSNFVGAHMVFLLPITGVMFLKSKLPGKIICLVHGALTLNALVMFRSRGAFLALLCCVLPTIFLINRKFRIYVFIGMLIAAAGFVHVTDDKFWDRISTITATEENRDGSAAGRLRLWQAAFDMSLAYPLGIGADNYHALVGSFTGIEGMDPHTTYLKCLAELGYHGMAILLLFIINAFKILFTIRRFYRNSEFFYDLHAFGLLVGLTGYLVAAFFISLLYTEEFYWLLMFPLFLKRAIIYDTLKGRQDA